MSKLKLLSVAVIALLLINVAIVGFLLFRKPPHLPEGRPPTAQAGPRQIIIDRLNLNAEQVGAYDKLINAHQVLINQLEDSVRVLKNDLYQTLNDESFAGKDSLIIRLGEIQEQIELTNYNHFGALKKLCRPDQLDKFNKLTNDLAGFFATKKNDVPSPPKQ